MAVEIKAGSTFEPGVPKLLFDVATARTLATALLTSRLMASDFCLSADN